MEKKMIFTFGSSYNVKSFCLSSEIEENQFLALMKVKQVSKEYVFHKQYYIENDEVLDMTVSFQEVVNEEQLVELRAKELAEQEEIIRKKQLKELEDDVPEDNLLDNIIFTKDI